MATPRKTTPKTAAPAPAAPAAPAPARATSPAKSEVKGSGTIAKPAARAITHDMIAKRVYEIYAGRGYAPGNPDADWTEAERQLRAGL
jgi:hypothetical protein